VTHGAAGLGLLKGDRFKCALEVFSSQTAGLLPVIHRNPEIGSHCGAGVGRSRWTHKDLLAEKQSLRN